MSGRQTCYICLDETDCPEKSDYIGALSPQAVQSESMARFISDAQRLSLNMDTAAKDMPPAITIALPCGHCVHTKCIKGWIEMNASQARKESRSCGMCRYPLPQLSMKAETYLAFINRILTTPDEDQTTFEFIAQMVLRTALLGALHYLAGPINVQTYATAAIERLGNVTGLLGGAAHQVHRSPGRARKNRPNPKTVERAGARKSPRRR
jgi:hypothetical protein